MNKRAFGELESEILEAFKTGKRQTVREIHKMLGEEKNKYTTVMTVMARLCEKKVLMRERVGLQYEYWLVGDATKVPNFIEHLKRKFFGVKTSQMVSYLIESADDISDEELAKMQEMIEKRKSSYGTGVQ